MCEPLGNIVLTKLLFKSGLYKLASLDINEMLLLTIRPFIRVINIVKTVETGEDGHWT